MNDSSPRVLDVVGATMVRAVALEADRAIFAGTGTNDQPLGIVGQVDANVGATVDFPGIVGAAGTVRAAGGQPDVLYLAPGDLTALQPAEVADGRPLLQPDATLGAVGTIGGLTIWPTPAMPAGTALVAQASQIIVAVREDASVAVSEHALFGYDGSMVRVIARLDAGIGDAAGLCTVGAE